MPQNLSTAQLAVTGVLADGSTEDDTGLATFAVSDSSIVTVGTVIGVGNGAFTVQPAGKIWGANVSVTATYGGQSAVSTVKVIASDSGSVAPKMPQQDDHWVALGLSPWGSYWGLQEPSGSYCISSGSTIVALTASVQAGAGQGPQMQSTEPGWTRNFIVMTGSAGMNMSWPGNNNGPSMAESIAFLLYGHVGLSAAATVIAGTMRVNSTSVASILCDNLNADSGMLAAEMNAQFKKLTGPVSSDVSDRVHPMLLVVNTSSFTTLAATDVGIITSASDALSWNFINDGNSKGFGGYTSAGKAASGSYSYFAVCTGSLAESLSDPQTAGSFLTSLGWNVNWASCPTDSGTIKLPFLPFHWTSLGLQPWTATWNMQETAGSILSTNDVWAGKNWNGMNLTPSAADDLAYNPAGFTGGWTRNGIMVTEASSHIVGRLPVSYGPPCNFDPTGSFALLTYLACYPATTAKRAVMAMAHVTTAPALCHAIVDTNGFPLTYCAGATGTGTLNVADSKVHPWLLVYDKTNSRVKLYTDLEPVTGAFNALSIVTSQTASLGFGGLTGLTNTPPSGVFMYGAFTTGTLAESLSDDGVASSFLKTLGWTLTW